MGRRRDKARDERRQRVAAVPTVTNRPRLADKLPVLRFVGWFGLVVVLYYAFTLTPLFDERLFPAYLEATADASARCLGWLGHDARSSGASLTTDDFGLEIRKGCDAIEPSALLLAAIVAFPVPWRFKLTGALIGVPALLLINLLRIVTLYLAGIHFPEFFHTLHIEIWQPLFIAIGLATWVLWVVWTLRHMAGPREA